MKRAILAILIYGTAVGLFALWFSRLAPVPRDIALVPPLPSGPLRIVVLGTSLSAPPQTWPVALAFELTRCRGADAKMLRVAGPGQGSAWGLTQIEAVAAAQPDLVLIEFAINDADLRDGVSLSKAAAQHRTLIVGLRKRLPHTSLVLMSMSPAQGPRGWIRAVLHSHYAQYHALASQAGIGFADLYPRWLALPRGVRGLEEDGLHPASDVATGVLVPVLRDYLAPGCAEAPS